MSRTVEILVHVPAVYLEPWREITDPHPAQTLWLELKQPDPISIKWPTPKALLDVADYTRQMEMLGAATFAALRDDKTEDRRRFHRSIIGERYLQAEGTTILVTGYDHTKNYVIAATWDDGEPLSSAMERLVEFRNICRLPSPVARALIKRILILELPPPQLVLSNVIPVGIERPGSNLAGYAGSLQIPMTLCVGTEETQLIVDHRVCNPHDEQYFRDKFLEALNANL